MALSSWSFNWEDCSVNEYRVQSLPRGKLHMFSHLLRVRPEFFN